MSERVFPASKPSTTNPTVTNGGAAPSKAHPYNHTARPPYRPQPLNRRHYHRPRRNYCCCCCFWTILILLILAFLAAVSSMVVYMLYRPHRPTFNVDSLRSHRFNLTTSADSSSHISSLFNLTISSKNPNSRISFSYDPFEVSLFSSPNGVFIGNGSLPAFVSGGKNETTFRAVVLTASNDLDAEGVNGLRSDLTKRSGSVELKIQMDTRVEVKMEKLKSKKVGIRVSCDGIRGVLPKGKSPAVANVAGAKCEVDLRIKIWNWSF